MSDPTVKKRNLQLFITFLKIGAFTFGGGYAMIPLIEREMVQDRDWITQEEMLDMVAIAETTPGPLAVNSATFVGWKVAGFRGSLCATFGVTLPSFLIMLAVALIMRHVENIPVVTHAFTGIRAAVLTLIGSAFVSMFRQLKKSPFSLIFCFSTLIAVGLLHLNAVLVIAVGIVIGILHTFLKGKSHDIS